MHDLIAELVRECILAEKKKRKPGGALTDMGAYKKINPDKFRSLVQTAMQSTDGEVDDAADKIDVSTRSMYNYLKEPGLKKIKTAAEREEKEK